MKHLFSVLSLLLMIGFGAVAQDCNYSINEQSSNGSIIKATGYFTIGYDGYCDSLQVKLGKFGKYRMAFRYSGDKGCVTQNSFVTFIATDYYDQWEWYHEGVFDCKEREITVQCSAEDMDTYLVNKQITAVKLHYKDGAKYFTVDGHKLKDMLPCILF